MPVYSLPAGCSFTHTQGPVSYTHLDVYKRQDKYGLVVSARYVREAGLSNPILILALAAAVVIGLMYLSLIHI